MRRYRAHHPQDVEMRQLLREAIQSFKGFCVFWKGESVKDGKFDDTKSSLF
jgi:hypothetical protein